MLNEIKMNVNTIEIRQLDLYDAPKLTTLANNINIWNNLRDYIPYPYRESDAVDFFKLSENEVPRQNYGITCNKELCGVIGLIIQKDVYRKSGELGFWIGEGFWGKGIATKAVDLITEYGFIHLQLVRIQAGVFEYNHASMKVLEKNGYAKEGVFKKAIIKNGKMYDEHRCFKLNENGK